MGIMGKDGIGMGNTQRLRSPVWVCSFHEVRFSRKLWIVQGQRKSVKKKRPYVARGRCATQGLILLLLSGCQRMQLFAPIRMREILNDSIPDAYFAVVVERRVTSWAPPSTMETEETRVSLASLCRSGMVRTPQLHMVDLTLYREASTLSCREPA